MSLKTPLQLVEDACAGFERVGVAVSGGGDSMAALVLAVEVLGAARVFAITIDHGLRPEAAAEAEAVAARCEALGVAHQTRRWVRAEGHPGNLQDAARGARRELIATWARAFDLHAVILGHTLDDQAETVLMRLARGSGVDGLSGMSERHVSKGTVWLRPLLRVSRATLREVLEERGETWFEDPSNQNDAYLRSRSRKALEVLEGLGIHAGVLADTAARMAQARALLERLTDEAITRHAVEDRGTVLVSPEVFDLDPELRDRVFARLVQGIGNSVYRPRYAALKRWIAAREGALMGCMMTREGETHWRIFREWNAVRTINAPSDGCWDGRWTAHGPGGADLRALGESGLRQLSAQAKAGEHPHWRESGLSAAVLRGLPALWVGERLVAAPLAGWPQGWALKARPLAALADDLS